MVIKQQVKPINKVALTSIPRESKYGINESKVLGLDKHGN